MGPKGYAPRQLFLPAASAIPGITDGNIATDSMISDSRAVHEIFNRARAKLMVPCSPKKNKAIGLHLITLFRLILSIDINCY